jgi:hypothetical protein
MVNAGTAKVYVEPRHGLVHLRVENETMREVAFASLSREEVKKLMKELEMAANDV